MTHQISNISFNTSGLSEEMYLIKIQGGFKCNEDEAKLILEKIKAGEILTGTAETRNQLSAYGIYCSSISFEDLESKKQRQVEEEESRIQLEINLNKANSWFEGLSKEEQKYVELLGFHRFYLVATG